MSADDLYRVLGVKRDSSKEEIKRAYRKKALQHHPDKNPDDADSAQKLFQEISLAYEVLSDDAKRARYDATGHISDDDPPPHNPMHFTTFFDFFGTPSPHVDDVSASVQLNLREIKDGGCKRVDVQILDRCGQCADTCGVCRGAFKVHVVHGPFQIQIPCPECSGQRCSACGNERVVRKTKTLEIRFGGGVANGETMRLVGKGSYVPSTRRYGDVNLTFTYDTNDLEHRNVTSIDVKTGKVTSVMKMSLHDVFCGFEKIVTLYDDNETVTLRSASATCPDAPVVLKGRGLRDGESDWVVQCTVDWPEDMSPYAKFKDIFAKIFPARRG